MKYFNPLIVLFILTSCLLNPLQAQKQEKADKIYDELGYKTSVPLLEATIQKDESKADEEHINKIANSYRLIHDTENAEKWYKELLPLSDDPIHLLYYAQALQSNGKYEKAKEYFLRYNNMVGATDNRGEVLGAAIDRMNEFKRTDIEIKNEYIINSENLDFSPAYHKRGILFVSSRKPDNRHHKNKDIWIDDNFMTLFYAHKKADGTLGSPAEFSDQINTKYHEGPLTFSANGQKLFFTRSNYNNGKKRKSTDDIVRLNIYTSNKKGSDWSDPTVLPFSTDEFDETHPSLSSDNTLLFFSSNREGGFGGMDLYVSEYKLGKWSEPKNLGAKINTPGNEIFPFIHDDGTLYYSSNGLGGLGGLDIFSAIFTEETKWSEPLNIGRPFNSSKDDFGFILNVLGTEGYLSSARKGGIGLDDIYSFTMPPDELKKPQFGSPMTSICTYEKMTGNMIPEAEVMVIERIGDGSVFKLGDQHTIFIPPARSENALMSILKKRAFAKGMENKELIHHTDAQGKMLFNKDPDKDYIFIARKEGYEMADNVFSTKGINNSSQPDLCIPLVGANCLTLEGIVTNLKDGSRISNATVTLINHCTNDIQAVESDLLGAFSFPCLDLKCTYTLKAQKVYYSEASENIDLFQQDISNKNSLYYNLQLSSVYDNTASVVTPSDPRGTQIAVGTVIELENIYYDFDEYYIRPGAAESLDKVVALLRRYPSMHIDLSAHTDCRGTWQYNRKLSKKRAEYAVRYLIKKGIDGRRLKPRGWGESRLRNNCDDKTYCSEEAHQYNRRTEIQVTQFDRKDISLRYVDNPPEVIDPYIPRGRKSR